jgi:CO/xanthine dehydrogenase FAD-binding subunit
MTSYLRPVRLQDALDRLRRDRPRILAGGTDVYPNRARSALAGDWLDITAIEALRGIESQAGHWRLGAATTWSELLSSKLPPLFDGLKGSANQIGGPQVQNTGTIGGNLCNASPAADGVPALLALDASVELSSCDAVRTMALADFIVGPRQTVLRPGELLTAILLPKPALSAASHFTKLGSRASLVISIVSVAATIEHEAGVVRAARIAVGACSPVALRLPALEAELTGKPLDSGLGRHAMPGHFASLAPLDDVRASAEYRGHAALTLARRALNELGARA